MLAIKLTSNSDSPHNTNTQFKLKWLIDSVLSQKENRINGVTNLKYEKRYLSSWYYCWVFVLNKKANWHRHLTYLNQVKFNVPNEKKNSPQLVKKLNKYKQIKVTPVINFVEWEHKNREERS